MMTDRFRSSRPELLLRKGVLKVWSKFTGEHPCQSAISIKLLWNFIEITLRHGLSPVSLLHIFRKPFSKNTSGRLLLYLLKTSENQNFSDVFMEYERGTLVSKGLNITVQKKRVFFSKGDQIHALFSWSTRSEIRPFALLPTKCFTRRVL